jgi:pyrroloquinoline quinone (PQQ) biosynthesis protein C
MSLIADKHCEAIDSLIDERALSEHNFVRAWHNGELEIDEIRAAVPQLWHLISSLPRMLAATCTVTVDTTLRRGIVQVLADIECNPPSAAELWLQTCASLGLFSEHVREAQPSEATAAAIDRLLDTCTVSTVSGIAACHARLRPMRNITALLSQGLQREYDMIGGAGLTFFEDWGAASAAHTKALRSLLDSAIRTEDDAQQARTATVETLAALEQLFDGLN